MTDVHLCLSVYTYIHMHIPTLITTDVHLCLYVCTRRLTGQLALRGSSLGFGILTNKDNEKVTQMWRVWGPIYPRIYRHREEGPGCCRNRTRGSRGVHCGKWHKGREVNGGSQERKGWEDRGRKRKKKGGGSTSRPTSPVHPVACKKNKQGWVLVRLPGQACLGAECGLPRYSRTACWLL